MERLFNQFQPKSYQLLLDVRTAERMLVGQMVVVGIPKLPTVQFHANGLKIIEVGQNKRKLNFSQTGDILTIHDIDPPSAEKNHDQQLAARDDQLGANPETITLSLAWQAPIDSKMTGAYLSTYQVGEQAREIVATQFESHYARNVFPCIDEPEAKAEFHLVLIHDPQMTALSNTPPATRLELENERVRIAFHKTPPMSTYLLAFAVGNFHALRTQSSQGVEIATYATANHPEQALQFANTVAVHALDFFAEKFGIRYPLNKLDQVALPDFEAGAMENWGLITYRESALIAAPDASIEAKKHVALVIAHEISHQWFGNLVTMRWWDDLWLNESFATYMEYRCIDALYPEWRVMDDFYLGERAYAMQRDLLPNVQTVRQTINSPEEIQTLFDGAIVYAKGACLLAQLVAEIGEPAFYAGLKNYFTKHAFRNTTADDLWAELPDAKRLMDYWLNHPGYPYVDGQKQRAFSLKGLGWGAKYPLPQIKTDLSGYYLLPVTSEKVAQFTAATPEQRARLLTDARLLAEAGTIKTDLALQLLARLANEQDFLVWSAASYLINFLRCFLEPESLQMQQFKTLLGRLALPSYLRLGLASVPNEPVRDTELRTLIVGLMAYAEHPDLLNQLLALDVHQPSTLDANLRATILGVHVKFGSGAIADFLLDKYQNETIPEVREDIAQALASAKHPDMIALILAKLLDPNMVRPQDLLSFVGGLLANPYARTQTFDWIRSQWTTLDQLFRGHDLIYYPRLLGRQLRTVAELAIFKEFFRPLAKQPDLAREIAIAEPAIQSRATLIIRERERFSAALSQLLKG